jgi:hypothetical protein
VEDELKVKRTSLLAVGVPLVAGLFFSVLSLPACAQTAKDLSAFVGRWQIDLSKTRMGRFGPSGQNMVRAASFTFIFEPEKHGLLIHVYEKYPQPAPTRTMNINLNGKLHSCENAAVACLTVGGDAAEQSYAYHKVDSHMLVRLFYLKGSISEYSTYAVSTDGKSFTMMSWSAETPEYQNIQVFEKQP